MISSVKDRGLDAALKCDLAVLNTLTHVGWLNMQLWQALCFPGLTIATVRTRLRYLEEAHWIEHIRWRVGPNNGGQIWSITWQGFQMVERYLPVLALRVAPDLTRPTTALEQEEWRVRLAIRTFVVRLILAARQRPLLSSFTLTLPQIGWPSALGGPALRPDGELSIAWQPAVVKPDNWLPWPSMTTDVVAAVRYPIYIDRAVELSHLSWLVEACAAEPSEQRCIPVVVLQREDHYRQAKQELEALSLQRSVRLATWVALDASIIQGGWREQDQAAPLGVLGE